MQFSSDPSFGTVLYAAMQHKQELPHYRIIPFRYREDKWVQEGQLDIPWKVCDMWLALCKPNKHAILYIFPHLHDVQVRKLRESWTAWAPLHGVIGIVVILDRLDILKIWRGAEGRIVCRQSSGGGETLRSVLVVDDDCTAVILRQEHGKLLISLQNLKRHIGGGKLEDPKPTKYDQKLVWNSEKHGYAMRDSRVLVVASFDHSRRSTLRVDEIDLTDQIKSCSTDPVMPIDWS